MEMTKAGYGRLGSTNAALNASAKSGVRATVVSTSDHALTLKTTWQSVTLSLRCRRSCRTRKSLSKTASCCASRWLPLRPSARRSSAAGAGCPGAALDRHAFAFGQLMHLPPFCLPHSSLMLGVSNLFDDPLTADVRIIVAEREMPAPQADDLSETDVTASPPSGLHTPRAAQTASAPKLPRYRKRVLYAHSGIMKARSEYFAAMLGNDGGTGWAETAEGSSGPTSEGGRKMHTIRIEDFDFTTTYWLLRWIYTNQMAFLPSEDVRACPPHEGSDLPAGWLTSTSIGTVPPTHFAGPSRPRGSPSSTSFSAIRQFHEDPWGWKTFLHHLPGGGPQSPPLHHPSSYHYRTGSSDGGTSDTFSHLETVSEGGGVFGPTGAHGPSGKRVASGPVPPRGMATRRPTGPVRPVPSTSGTTSTTTTTKPTEKKRTSSPAAAAGTDSATPTTPGPSSSSSSPTVTEEPEGRVSPLQSFAAAYAASTSPMAGLPSVRKPTAGVPAAGSTAKGGAVSGRATPAVSATTTTPGITTKTATATKSASAPQAAGASARSTGRTTPSGKSERGGAGGNGLMRDPHAHPAAVTDKGGSAFLLEHVLVWKQWG